MSIPTPNLARRALGFAGAVVAEAACLAASVPRLVRDAGPAALSRPDPADLRAGRLREHPVMLVHGLGADKSSFAVMATALRRAGFTVYGAEYACRGSTLPDCAAQLERSALRFRAETNCETAHVVAHSLGGVVLRWAVEHTWMGTWVGTAITLGSPHRGTPTAAVAPAALPGLAGLLPELRPGTAADRTVTTGPVRWVAVGAEHDWVVPPDYATLPESGTVRNVRLPGCGHLALTRHPDCVSLVLDELVRAEEALSDRRWSAGITAQASAL